MQVKRLQMDSQEGGHLVHWHVMWIYTWMHIYRSRMYIVFVYEHYIIYRTISWLEFDHFFSPSAPRFFSAPWESITFQWRAVKSPFSWRHWIPARWSRASATTRACFQNNLDSHDGCADSVCEAVILGWKLSWRVDSSEINESSKNTQWATTKNTEIYWRVWDSMDFLTWGIWSSKKDPPFPG